MDSETIILSIRRALECEYDRASAIARLRGAMAYKAGSELRIKKERGYYRFYEKKEGKKKMTYLSRSNKRLYGLARKKYCNELLKLLSMGKSRREKQLNKLKQLLYKFESGGLELERIVYSHKQYRWYRGRFARKEQGDASHPLEDYFVRSKSEQNVGKSMLRFGVPFHFEERLIINVQELVEKLREKLENEKFYNWEFSGKLYFVKDGVTIWLVPPELRWMNASGSVWKTYDPKTGCITIYPDFKIMLADGSVVRWEHEGLTDDFIYRCNASERVSIMLITRTIEASDLITTYEFDADDEARLERIISEVILPRLWW